MHGQRLPIVVFALMGEGNVVRAIRGERVGTLICRTTPGKTRKTPSDRSH